MSASAESAMKPTAGSGGQPPAEDASACASTTTPAARTAPMNQRQRRGRSYIVPAATLTCRRAYPRAERQPSAAARRDVDHMITCAGAGWQKTPHLVSGGGHAQPVSGR